jgi:hypothetical protein
MRAITNCRLAVALVTEAIRRAMQLFRQKERCSP